MHVKDTENHETLNEPANIDSTIESSTKQHITLKQSQTLTNVKHVKTYAQHINTYAKTPDPVTILVPVSIYR